MIIRDSAKHLLILTVGAVLLAGTSQCTKRSLYEDTNETGNLMPPSSIREGNDKKGRVFRRIARIRVRDKSEVDELANMGLDIWEVQQNYIITSVTDDEMAVIKTRNFPVEILFWSQAEYEAFIKSRKCDVEAPGKDNGHE